MATEIQLISINDLDQNYDLCCRHLSLFLHVHRTNVQFEIVLHRILNRDKVFSLFRSDDLDESQRYFENFKEKLPLLEKHSSNVNVLKKVCDIIYSNHLSQNIAHINVHLDDVQFFQQNSSENLSSYIYSDDSDGYTPLSLAFKLKRSKIALEILSKVSFPTRLTNKDKDLNNLFHFVAKNDSKICEKLCQIIDNQSIIQNLINEKNLQNETPLHIACQENNAECIKVLLKNGANINSASTNDNYHYHHHIGLNEELVDKLDVNDKIKNGGTPLHWCEKSDIIDLLAENGCDLNAKDFDGNTALHIMIMKNDLNCTLSLLSNGADVNSIGSDGNTPLHLAVKIDNFALVQSLIVFGANVNQLNLENHHSSRHLAANSNLSDSNKKKMIYILHSVGAIRCDYKKTDCNEYCSPDYTDNDNDLFNEISFQQNYLYKDEFLWKNFNLNNDEQKNGKKLLCLDGGGIRGLILIQILCHLEHITKKQTVEIFDWIAGTSTGGILALLLASGYTALKCRSIYFQLKDKIFNGNRTHSTELLEKLIKQYLGDEKRLCDLPSKPRLFITATNVEHYPPKAEFFRNYLNAEQLLLNNNIENNEWEYLWKVARATSAAPTYFNQCEQYIDGALVANNPTLDLLTEIESIKRANKIMDKNNNTEILDIDAIVSIGTGEMPKKLFERLDFDFNWSILSKYQNLFKIIIEQASQSNGRVVERAQAWCSMINVPFYRLNPLLSEEIILNETNNVKLLQMLWETEAYIHLNADHINQLSIRLLDEITTSKSN
ncbi:85/88 kDa calcium-independent phospholipase A2-like [Dermatophagoides pteronyssinus]|uniref:85/88 kDa calcium-independent phospholipase A2-like n=1 Tax=Dermatophagoides pteronyssinus TaxID=6956 RepID=UPI003F672799